MIQRSAQVSRCACLLSVNALLKVPKAEIVLTTHETLAADSSALKGITWECIVMDHRERMRTSFAKAASAVRELPSRHRLLLSHTHPCQVCVRGCIAWSGA